MSKAPQSFKLPPSIKAEAQRLAKADGISLDQWISIAVAQKISAVGTAEDFFKRRAKGARPGSMLNFLRGAPNVPPIPGDELP